MIGTVRLFSPRGFGFISCDGNDDLFFHVSQLPPGEYGKKSIAEGTVVEFELGNHKGREVAKRISIIDAGGGR
jgi:cold shock CspA family protein